MVLKNLRSSVTPFSMTVISSIVNLTMMYFSENGNDDTI